MCFDVPVIVCYQYARIYICNSFFFGEVAANLTRKKQKTNQSKIGKLKIDNESSKTPQPCYFKESNK